MCVQYYSNCVSHPQLRVVQIKTKSSSHPQLRVAQTITESSTRQSTFAFIACNCRCLIIQLSTGELASTIVGKHLLEIFWQSISHVSHPQLRVVQTITESSTRQSTFAFIACSCRCLIIQLSTGELASTIVGKQLTRDILISTNPIQR